MEANMTLWSFLGSAFSTVLTIYFWFVRMRRERPSLRPHLLDHEFFLASNRDDERLIGVRLGFIVANHSVLPNAVLRARLHIRLGDGWHEVGQLAFDKQTPQPVNVCPLQTVLLRLTGTLNFPYNAALETGSQAAANYLDRFAVQPLRFKIELQRLNDQTDVHEIELPRIDTPPFAARRRFAA